MNIDQRIEALTHSVELLSQMHQDNEKTYAKLFRRNAKLLNRLANIALAHEERITDLEERHEQK